MCRGPGSPAHSGPVDIELRTGICRIYITRVHYGRVNMMYVHAARLTIVAPQTVYIYYTVRQLSQAPSQGRSVEHSVYGGHAARLGVS